LHNLTPFKLHHNATTTSSSLLQSTLDGSHTGNCMDELLDSLLFSRPTGQWHNVCSNFNMFLFRTVRGPQPFILCWYLTALPCDNDISHSLSTGSCTCSRRQRYAIHQWRHGGLPWHLESCSLNVELDLPSMMALPFEETGCAHKSPFLLHVCLSSTDHVVVNVNIQLPIDAVGRY
jgi:hypothetical protein